MDTTTGTVVALKATESAKSRLGVSPDALRRRLAWTMAVDTLTALAAAVDRVVVVGNQPALESQLRRHQVAATVLTEPDRGGMNAALAAGATLLRRTGCRSVLACVGDLPALRADSVRQLLEASRPFSRAFLADSDGVGTTMLIANAAELEPRFQGPSAAAHEASGAVSLDDRVLTDSVADARRDVDTERDLREAFQLGLGALTAALFDPETGALGRYDVITTVADLAADGNGLATTSGGVRVAISAAAVRDSLRVAHAGQRLHAVLSNGRVLAAWL